MKQFYGLRGRKLNVAIAVSYHQTPSPLAQAQILMLLNIQIVAGTDFTLFGYDQVKTMLCFLHRTLKF